MTNYDDVVTELDDGEVLFHITKHQGHFDIVMDNGSRRMTMIIGFDDLANIAFDLDVWSRSL